MPKTLTCKKCGYESPVGTQCARCGGKLNPNQAHLLWRRKRIPARDWMCWNAVARIVLPVAVVILVVSVAGGLMAGGLRELEKLLPTLLPTMAALLAGVGAAVLLALVLRGGEIVECVADNRGVSLRTYLSNPTRLKLLCGLRSAALMRRHEPGAWLLVDEQTLTWKEIARVQLWPEKRMALFYSPGWWLRVCLPCDGTMWNELKALIREKLGKSKTVSLPMELRNATKPSSSRKAPRATQHPAPFTHATDHEADR